MSLKPTKNPPLAVGRGALENPAGRFEKLAVESERPDIMENDPPPERQVPTEIFRDTSRSIISANDSPDIGMMLSVNPYRGCEHGCIYCYARPYHEYLGLSAGLDFETKIFAKTDAPLLLRQKLMARNWQPQTITFSGATDCYQPVERKLQLTRACVAVMTEFRNPLVIITKNALVTRDIDLLQQLAAHRAVTVYISLTSLRREIARVMEPRAATPPRRLQAIATLAQAGIPVNAMIAPVVPGLTDHEIPALLRAAADAGAGTAYYNIVRLPHGVKDLFESWAKQNFPDRADKILNRIRAMRQGRLNDPAFGSRMRGEGIFADQIAQSFAQARKRYGLNRASPRLSAAAFRRPSAQGDLFS